MSKPPPMLQVVESFITPWDALLADIALDVLETNPDEGEIAEQCAHLARHTLECLVSFVKEVNAADFESVSDCIHAKNGGLPKEDCPAYIDALLDIRAGALSVVEQIEDDIPVSPKRVADLVNDLKRMEAFLASREYLNSKLAALVAQERAARSRKMATAREARPETHPWEAVEKLVDELLAAGKDERSLAGIVEKRLGIPQRTFRRWRRKTAT